MDHRSALIALPLLVLAGCTAGARPAEGPSPARLALEPCSLAALALPARCGTLAVPEDPERAGGRQIALNVAVLPADSPSRADAVFLLAGGPGQAATALGPVLAELRQLHPNRDLVLVDQRGTGRSNPLVCGSGSWVENARAGLPFLPSPAGARECAARLSERADLRLYGTPQAVADLEAVRAALGYERINLIGISYGTRVAQVYMREHPERVRSAVLRAVAPLGFNIPVDGAVAAQAALDRVVAECAADAACAAAFPAVAAELDSLFANARTAPAAVPLPVPGTGDTVVVRLTPELLASTLNVLLLGPTQRMVPLLVHRAHRQGAQALAPVLVPVLSAVYGPLPVGMYLSVVCTEDAPRITAADAERARRSFMPAVDGTLAACEEWPRGSVDDAFHAPLRSDVPVLLVSGAADPATVPEMGERALRHLPNGRHLVVPATSHGPAFPGCVAELVRRFVDTGSAEGLNEGCVQEIRWPAFAGTDTLPQAGSRLPSALPPQQ